MEPNLKAAIRDVRDVLLAIIAEHERRSHNGQPCPHERANTIAYIMHALGSKDLGLIQQLLADYDNHCPHQPPTPPAGPAK